MQDCGEDKISDQRGRSWWGVGSGELAGATGRMKSGSVIKVGAPAEEG